ncbi:MAG: Recombination protein RecR [Candidatus Nomurabacteria bacterium GW2011_GWF2_35_66]|uniref:Recombination protein RecR n=1 Tax=Candidatus Nomurabacteria bacterium GW2011_GWE1_35_16 TaxID=1618761 RepID=A0A0G0BAV2_9BACT|nr:MAG: Recombination protein RecR [Candidatus Nomurabacteria bacterium GW2011_GWF1_34_20]KKP63371.1 MAG: Recombination protein RecR [Candidatus Nomurabacteria bacterium GW2011_GWE2_34_25]KKP66563.1 MAG: Recombination protein RecR [Candidatus Nomurabacteria bacterium GW2011_GWE1_35_16]KKP83609.1 MAG: Recombination protein RecR [Candidatus Nomurabacteria bacterium GW2011_GWF2_35_66]HAE36869.1 recombination protein RecR [Candidatus Nomurabacteria bacterium]
MDPINKLTEHFKEFPGIGERQAKRFVYFLLHKNPSYVKELGDKILDLKNTIHQCPSCFLFFQSTQDQLCDVCSNPKTDKTSLLIVEKDADYENIRRSRNYSGMYFILGGLVPIVTKDTPNYVRTKELLRNIENQVKQNGLKEVIIALSLNPQGEHTDMYLREILTPLKDKYSFNIVSLGRGLSTGTELEYSDSETIKNALRNRA